MIDVRDSLGCWCVAIVREMNNNMVLVNFLGWRDSFNEWISIHETGLRPWQSHTTYYGELRKWPPQQQDHVDEWRHYRSLDFDDSKLMNCWLASPDRTTAINRYIHKYGVPENLA